IRSARGAPRPDRRCRWCLPHRPGHPPRRRDGTRPDGQADVVRRRAALGPRQPGRPAGRGPRHRSRSRRRRREGRSARRAGQQDRRARHHRRQRPRRGPALGADRQGPCTSHHQRRHPRRCHGLHAEARTRLEGRIGMTTTEVIRWDTDEQKALRQLAADFTRKEIVPHLDEWERAGEIPRELHRKAADAGLLGASVAEEHGGSGGTALDMLAILEEIILAGGSSGLISALFSHGIATPHIVSSGNTDLIERFARPALEGRAIGSLAISEPSGGSDVANIRTTARRDGDEYVINGAKLYITSGTRADFVTTAVRTGDAGAGGISLVVVPTDTPG